MLSRIFDLFPTRILRASFCRHSHVFVFLLAVSAVTVSARQSDDLSKAVEREIGGGESHSYKINLASGQFLRVVVEQKGLDVAVALFGTNDKLLIEVNTRDLVPSSETLYWVAKEAGNYRLQLRPVAKESPPGRYVVKIEELREARAEDSDRVVAQQSVAEGMRLIALGTADSRREAIKKFEAALQIQKRLGDQAGEGDSLDSLGSIYYYLGETRKSLDHYIQALPLRRAAGDRNSEAATLNDIGVIYYSLGEGQKALDYYNQSLQLKRAVGDRKSEAVTLNNIGVSYSSLGEEQKAIEHYNQALQLRREMGDRNGEAVTLNNIGRAYYLLGENQKAIEYYNQALPLRRALNDRRGEAVTLNSIGVIHARLGESQKALDYYNQALQLNRAIGDRRSEASTLNNIGEIYARRGEYQKTLDYYNQSLQLSRAAGDRRSEVTVLNSIGLAYSSLGEIQKAIEHYNQALPLSRATGDRRGEAITLNNIGLAYTSLGENQKAIEYYNQSLQLSRAAGDRRTEAATLNNIGLAYSSLDENQKALDFRNRALSLMRAVGDRRGEAITLNNIGGIYSSLGEEQKAIEHYDQALLLSRAVGERGSETATLNNLARAYARLGEYQKAQLRIEEALALIESIRASVEIQELRASYLASRQDSYELYVDLLVRLNKQQPGAGYDGLALEASERRRARSLLETLNEAHADIRQGIDEQLIERERDLRRQLNAKAAYQTRLLNGKHTKEQAEAVEKEIGKLTDDYQQIQARIRIASPRYAALTQPQPLTLKEIQERLLDRDTLLLEYALGKEGSHLFAVARDSINVFELPRSDQIEKAARHYYDLLTARNKRIEFETIEERRARIKSAEGELPEAATALSRMVLGPVSTKLGNRRLLIVGDGALQYIPLGALPSPATGKNRPLIADHEIVSLPSASTLAALRSELEGRKPAPRSIAVLADPVFSLDDERLLQARRKSGPETIAASRAATRGEDKPLLSELTRSLKDIDPGSGFNLPRLPFTRREAQTIAMLVPRADRKEALDFAASRAAATSAELSQYRIIHFATHGLLNSTHPELSGLVFSLVDERGQLQDGFLRAHEIFNLRLPAELVVLSGCRTGLGKEIRGEGIASLTRSFMYAGSRRVMVSLWDVDDKATAELMARFYRLLLGPRRMSAAAALRAAQVSMARSKGWSSPYYWAAFILQGETR
jgi:CHAT domain-containing protein/Tfp pilus assembly protein PilF